VYSVERESQEHETDASIKSNRSGVDYRRREMSDRTVENLARH